ncbi:MAG: hypothetical protein IT578_01040 [Verrucomicrobiae bacterium]|nr:hypothetical protein [Verrucomicrobiae bacterium]
MARAVTLPQDHPYQKVLREHLAAFTEADLAVERKKFTVDEEFLKDEERAFEAWLALSDLSRPCWERPDFRAPAEHYLLKTIESPEGLRMKIGRGRDLPHPTYPAWWATWKYPGNPYLGDKALLRRALVMAIADMVVYDRFLESPEAEKAIAGRTSCIGGHLLAEAYTYFCAKELLPEPVRKAYEEGMIKMFARLEAKGPDGINENINGKSLVGIAYLTKAVADPALARRCEAYAERMLSTKQVGIVHPVGVVRDAGGIETSYNGILLYDLVWAALATDWPILRESARELTAFKGKLTLPEPDGGYWFGPNHFNSRVGAGDSPNDQWNASGRDVGLAMLDDGALYLPVSYRRLPGSRSLDPRPGLAELPPLEKMQAALRAFVEAQNRETPSGAVAPFPLWHEGGISGHWGPMIPYASQNYRPGIYRKLKEFEAKKSELLVPPVTRTSSFTELLPTEDRIFSEADRNTFLLYRRPSFYAMVFSGRLGWHSFLNFGGGGLSAFWTPEGGPILLGRSNGYEGNQWKTFRLWPCNMVAGATARGDGFSTARLRREICKVLYWKQGEEAGAVYGGSLNASLDGGRVCELGSKGNLKGENYFERTVTLRPRGVEMNVLFKSDGDDRVIELFEVLPVFLRDARRQKDLEPATIEVLAGGEWKTVADAWTEGVERIRIRRAKGGAEIELDRPRRVKAATSVEGLWETTRPFEVRNLYLDLLGKDGETPFPSTEMTYRILPAP